MQRIHRVDQGGQRSGLLKIQRVLSTFRVLLQKPAEPSQTINVCTKMVPLGSTPKPTIGYAENAEPNAEKSIARHHVRGYSDSGTSRIYACLSKFTSD